MADVIVTTVNTSGQKALLRLDDENPRHVDLIESLRRQARREDLDTVKVEPVEKPRTPRKAAE